MEGGVKDFDIKKRQGSDRFDRPKMVGLPGGERIR